MRQLHHLIAEQALGLGRRHDLESLYPWECGRSRAAFLGSCLDGIEAATLSVQCVSNSQLFEQLPLVMFQEYAIQNGVGGVAAACVGGGEELCHVCADMAVWQV